MTFDEVSFFPRLKDGSVAGNPVKGLLFAFPRLMDQDDLGGWVVHQKRYVHPFHLNIELFPWTVSHQGEGFELAEMMEHSPFTARDKALVMIENNYAQIAQRIENFRKEREDAS